MPVVSGTFHPSSKRMPENIKAQLRTLNAYNQFKEQFVDTSLEVLEVQPSTLLKHTQTSYLSIYY